VFWKDLDNVYLGCNEKFAGDAGEETAEAVIGKKDYDFPWRDQADLYRNDDSKVMSSGQGKLNYEEPQTTPDGETIWLETSKVALRKIDGSIYGVLGVYHDITQRKIMEEELRESREIYAIAETIAHIGSWSWDLVKDKVSWSDEVFRIYGLSPQEFKPDFENFSRIVHPTDRQFVIDAVNESLENEGKVYNVEHRAVKPDGCECYVHQQAQIYRNESGKVIRMVGTTHDITERKNAEMKMLAAKNEAEKANKSKSTFLSNMSHELRTPLHGILSYAELGIKKSVDQGDEKLHKYFYRINSSGERLKVLLNDLLDISKLEAGKMQMDRKQENIVWIIESCIDEQKALAESRHLDISIKVTERVPAVVCDKNRIGQVVMNLLSNAIKFSPDEKEINIRVDQTELTDNDKQVDAVKICIADQGKGVAEADREIIFDKFVQSEQRVGFTTGTGLGLAISKELVNLHNGQIWCQQAIGGGAELVVVLPVEYQVINIG
ncbi:MAG: PAS domain-containing protein, partial [Gammaproteobacteria bacterium]|nr:PAS domain-containing protein [Gammaproteobacteria bacterium]